MPKTISLPEPFRPKPEDGPYIQQFSSRDVRFDLQFNHKTLRKSERDILIKDLTQVLADLHEMEPKE